MNFTIFFFDIFPIKIKILNDKYKYLTHFSIEQGKLGLTNITEHGWLLIIGRLDRTWMFWPTKSSITHWGPVVGRCWATTSHKLKKYLFFIFKIVLSVYYWDPPHAVCFDFFLNCVITYQFITEIPHGSPMLFVLIF